MIDMGDLIVSADKETVILSLVKSRERLEEARAFAAAANEAMFEGILNVDPDEAISIEDRIEAEQKIYNLEAAAEIAWARYEKALIRHGWEIAQAKKAGITDLPGG